MNSTEPQEAVAIIGMAGRFPKAKNLDEFWRNLRDGVECVSRFHESEIQWLPIEHKPDPKDPRYVPARAVLERPEWFDAAFFGMNPQEARIMDPQHRVFLECAWEALENAGCNPEKYPGLIGVYAGASMNSYLFTNLLTHPNLIADHGVFSTFIANDGDFVPTRVSYKLNLRGPSLNIQTACSTSLVAVCVAAQNLLSYRCDVALAGGVSITFPPNRGQFHLEGGILSNDGHCRAFDAKALGTVLGDGCGIVVLKRLSEAIAEGDHVCAVIKGTAINNDGAVKIGYTAPSIDGQAECIAMAHSEAGFDPATVSYVEAHGTGTPLGDPIEIAGLTKAFGLGGERGQFCAVGSVKSNIGHLDIGAGVAGLIKTVLALQHAEIPPSLHFEAPNPKIDFTHSPFFVNAQLRRWERNGAPRRAGVSSFGIGGTNAHVAIEEAPAQEPTTPAQGPQVLLVSAKTATALEAATENLAAHLEKEANAGRDVNLADVAYTLQVGRKTFAHRRAVVATSSAEAAQVLRAKEAKASATGHSEAENATVAFMFTGQGAQHVGMARELYESDAEFRAEVDRACELLRAKLGCDLREVMFENVARAACPRSEDQHGQADRATLLNETRFTQPALFVIEHALAQWWMRRGLKPAAMIGHSLGEYVAAALAGVFSYEDALALVAERARLMQAQPAGAMLAVRKPEAEVRGFLDSNLALAAVNAPGLCVVSGPFDAIDALERKLSASAIASKRLATSHAFHSAMMEGALAPLAAFLRRLRLNAPKLPFVSNVTGTWITAEQATSADYWAQHLRSTVRFADGIGALVSAGHRVLLEVGPGATLGGLARQHAAVAGGKAAVICSLGRAKDLGSEVAAATLALGELWIAGVDVDWRKARPAGERRRIVPLPTYPFERKRYVIEPGMSFALGNSGVERLDPEPLSGALSDGEPSGLGSSRSTSSLAALRALFGELSGVDLSESAAEASFYDLGFDSLFLTQASLAVNRKFGVEVTFRQLRDQLSSLAKLAAHVDEKRGVAPVLVAGPSSGESPTARRQAAALQEKRLPLTEAQREMWFASQLGEAVSSAYNEASILKLAGPLDVAALERALNQLVARHEALRTTFAANSEWQIIAPKGSVALSVQDFAASGAEVREARVNEWLEAEIQRPFNLTAGPLFRAGLGRDAAQNHILALVVHHIVSDGWSLGILARELAELYSAEVAQRPAQLPAAPSFAHYVERNTSAAQAPAYAAAEAFWKSQFAGEVPVLELPTDRPRPTQRTHEGGFVVRPLAPDVAAAVKRLCAERECTTFTALLATFNILLHRLSGQDDVVVGVPSAAQVMDGLENLVGHFANLLPVRSRVGDGERFADFLAATKQRMTDALEHWRYPFGALLQQLNLPRDPNRVPLAPVVFNTTRRRGSLEFAGLRAEVISNPRKFVNFDLNFNFALTGDTISLGCYYSTELYDEATIARWIRHFETLLRAAARQPDALVAELPLLTDAERREILVEWNQTALDYRRDACVPELFAEQAARTPDAVAVVGEHERLTYAELDRRAGALAGKLKAAGVGPDVPVGIFLERTPQLLVAMLGVLKAGGAYVPIDPALPRERVEFIVNDTAMPVIVAQRSLAEFLPATKATVVELDREAVGASLLATPANMSRASSLPQRGEARSSHLAYIIYTSGSTGRPKGVCLEHRGVAALIAWAQRNFRREELQGVLFSTSASFDVSVFETLVPLCLGAKIIVAENVLQIGALAARDEITLVSSVPSAVAELVRAKMLPPSVRTIVVAGEPCPQSLVESLYALPQIARVYDAYGPTETTVYSTGAERTRGGRATIGRPLPNEQAFILDRRMQPVPIGVPGELFIGGEKLARGYLNRPELTAERFAPNPLPELCHLLGDKRLYRTGDRARFLPDGSIEYLGRLDHQVKIRGYRIELGEIEAALAAQPGVAECAVLARPEANGSQRLVAYVVGAAGAAPDSSALRAALARRLPDYMAPAAIVALAKLPRTNSGKLDRRALPEPEFNAPAARVAPRTATEELLAEIWRDVLAAPQVGVHDNFFELGGHSLLAMQVIARVHDTLGVDLTMRQFFLAPTIAGLSPLIEEALIASIKAGTEADADAAGVLASAKE